MVLTAEMQSLAGPMSMDKAPYLADAHPPREIARMVERLDVVTLVVLAVLGSNEFPEGWVLSR